MIDLKEKKPTYESMFVCIYTNGVADIVANILDIDIKISINEPGGFIEYSICFPGKASNDLMNEKAPYGIEYDFYLKKLKETVEGYLKKRFNVETDIKFHIDHVYCYVVENDLKIKSMENLWMFLMGQGVIK